MCGFEPRATAASKLSSSQKADEPSWLVGTLSKRAVSPASTAAVAVLTSVSSVPPSSV